MIHKLPTKGYRFVKSVYGKYEEIPEKWGYPKFSEVVKVNPPTKIDEKRVPYLPMDAIDVDNPHFNYVEERKLSDFSSLPKFQENDVLFASITPSTENGKTCIVENFSRKGICSSELTILRASDEVVPKYLYYYVKSRRIRQFAISQMMGSTGRQRVPDYVFKKDLNFELPSKPEQQKISAILSNIDSTIHLTRKIIKKYEQIKIGMMQKMFPKWGEFPRNWYEKKLKPYVIGSGFTPRGGNEVYIEHGIPLIRSQNVHFDGLHLDDVAYITQQIHDEMDKTKLRPLDILLNITGASLGRCTIVPENFGEGNVNQHVCIIRTTDEINPKFLAYYFSTYEFQKFINIMQAGSSREGLTKQEIEKIILFTPSPKEQQKIVKILQQNDAIIKNEKKYLNKLLLIKEGLMNALLTGGIRVNV